MQAAIKTETIEFQSDGANIRAFLARPEAEGSRPAVVVLHEWWGLSESTQNLANRLAQSGFVALAPDLYSRQGNRATQDPQEAAALMEGVSSQQALRDLNQAVKHLKGAAGVDDWKIAALGLSMGAGLGLTVAAHNSDFKACAAFYGKVPPIETLNYLLCPVLFHHAGKDGWVTMREVQTLRQGLEKFGKPGEVHVYPEADHGFFNESRPEAYRADDAALAWQRTLAFFGKHLGE